MQHLVRHTTVAAAAVLALGGVAACGNGSGGSGGSASSGRSAADPSSSQGTTTPSPTPTSPTPSSAAGATLTGDSFVAAMTRAIRDHQSAHVTMSLKGALEASGDVSYAAGGPTMQMTMSMPGTSAQQIEMRFVDKTLYLAAPGLTPKGKFVAISKGDATFGALLKQLQGFGPEGAVASMKKGVKDFEHVGTTTIGGKSYEHYRVTVDPRALTTDLSLPGAAAGSIPKSVTEELYLDADNLLRRVTMQIMGHRMTVDATDWGKPVHVKAPPVAQITTPPTT